MVFHIVKDINDYYAHILNKEWNNNLIICYFTATWCGPCQTISPDITNIGEKAENILVLKIDVDDCEEVAAQCKIDCMPTFKFHLKNSMEPQKELMGVNKTELFNIIGSLLEQLDKDTQTQQHQQQPQQHQQQQQIHQQQQQTQQQIQQQQPQPQQQQQQPQPQQQQPQPNPLEFNNLYFNNQ